MRQPRLRLGTLGGTCMAIGHAVVTILPPRCLRPSGSRHRSEKLMLYAPLRAASIRFSLALSMSVHRGSCEHDRRAHSLQLGNIVKKKLDSVFYEIYNM